MPFPQDWQSLPATMTSSVPFASTRPVATDTYPEPVRS
jgi:hypothetical protein